MSKRITRKLTGAAKERIKKEYRSLKLSDFDGEALTYLRKVRGAAKGRKAKRDKIARVGDLVVPKDSEMYEIIKRAAQSKGMTVKQFMKKNKDAIKEFMQAGDIILARETEYLISDIKSLKKGKKLFVNDGNGYRHTGAHSDILAIQLFTQHIFGQTDIFLIVYRVHYKLNGDLTHYLPPASEYEDLFEQEEIEAVLDGYYPEITYLKSAKKNEKKEKAKIIQPYSKKRKGKNNPVRQPKRKTGYKVPKKK